MRVFDRDLIRAGHYGQRSCEPRKQAEHMAAPTNAANVKNALANSEPSTHGTEGELRPSGSYGRNRRDFCRDSQPGRTRSVDPERTQRDRLVLNCYCDSNRTWNSARSRRMELEMSDFNVGFVIFPDLTQLDFTGPLQVLARLPQSTTHIVAKSDAPVPSDCGLSLLPTRTFANCPPLDLICIPGGVNGVIGAIGDRETIEFVRKQADAAKYVTSVCTGAFVLGVAGLLKGRRVTTHWAYTDLLPLVGATYEKARVVKDGNVITAGGVTSGIDFGLTVVAELAGETTAQTIQLGIEYDPAPPFDSGHPDRAPTAVKSALSGRYEKANWALGAAIEQAARS
jgi:cyclohexyl-isocyanide hydratase